MNIKYGLYKLSRINKMFESRRAANSLDKTAPISERNFMRHSLR